MIDLNSILMNDAVQGIFKSTGLSKDEETTVASIAMRAVKEVFSDDPIKAASLFSRNPDISDDKKEENEIMSRFSNGLKTKGLSAVKIAALVA